MGVGNALNIQQPGFQSFNGISTFSGRTLTGGTGITISNGDGIAGNPVLSASGIIGQTITGNSGGPIAPSSGNWNLITANSTIKFVGSGSTQTLDFGKSDLMIGVSGANLTSTNQGNVTLGRNSGPRITDGVENIVIGDGTCQFLTTGSSNVVIAPNGYNDLTTGGNNILISTSGGILATGNNNIYLGNSGGASTSESNILRIGKQGSSTNEQNQCFIAGITGVTVSNANYVTVDTTTGQLGATATGSPGPTGPTGPAGPTGPTGASGGGITAFQAYPTANVDNVTGDGTAYFVVFDVEAFDTTGGFDTGTGIFTAQSTGLYVFSGNIFVYNLGVAHTLLLATLVTTSATYVCSICNPYVISTATELSVFYNFVVAMTATDTAKVSVNVNGGTKTVGVAGTNVGQIFCGQKIA